MQELIYCSFCDHDIPNRSLFIHAEESHVGPRPHSGFYHICCGACSFRVSHQSEENMVNHLFKSQHDPYKLRIDWSCFIKNENDRIAGAISAAVELLRQNDTTETKKTTGFDLEQSFASSDGMARYNEESILLEESDDVTNQYERESHWSVNRSVDDISDKDRGFRARTCLPSIYSDPYSETDYGVSISDSGKTNKVADDAAPPKRIFRDSIDKFYLSNEPVQKSEFLPASLFDQTGLDYSDTKIQRYSKAIDRSSTMKNEKRTLPKPNKQRSESSKKSKKEKNVLKCEKCSIVIWGKCGKDFYRSLLIHVARHSALGFIGCTSCQMEFSVIRDFYYHRKPYSDKRRKKGQQKESAEITCGGNPVSLATDDKLGTLKTLINFCYPDLKVKSRLMYSFMIGNPVKKNAKDPLPSGGTKRTEEIKVNMHDDSISILSSEQEDINAFKNEEQ